MSKGPIYGVELIDTLPLDPDRPDGMLQAMASFEDLDAVRTRNERVSAAYEVLLVHYKMLKAAVDEHLHRRTCHNCGNVAWHRDNVTPYVVCESCGSQDTRAKRPTI